MFKKVSIAWIVLGLVFSAGLAMSGTFEDTITRTYITPNLTNTTLGARPTNAIKGKIMFDSTLNSLITDDGSTWIRMLSSASKAEFTQATAPTVTGCTGGSVDTGSTDTVGRVSGINGTVCSLVFNVAYSRAPFAIVAMSSSAGGSNAPRHVALASGLDITNLAGTSGSVTYHVFGVY